MKNNLDSNIKFSANGEAYFDDCANPVQTVNAWRLRSSGGGRLRLWVSALLNAHHDRVIALGVYRRCRVDGCKSDSEQADRRAS